MPVPLVKVLVTVSVAPGGAVGASAVEVESVVLVDAVSVVEVEVVLVVLLHHAHGEHALMGQRRRGARTLWWTSWTRTCSCWC